MHKFLPSIQSPVYIDPSMIYPHPHENSKREGKQLIILSGEYYHHRIYIIINYIYLYHPDHHQTTPPVAIYLNLPS